MIGPTRFSTGRKIIYNTDRELAKILSRLRVVFNPIYSLGSSLSTFLKMRVHLPWMFLNTKYLNLEYYRILRILFNRAFALSLCQYRILVVLFKQEAWKHANPAYIRFPCDPKLPENGQVAVEENFGEEAANDYDPKTKRTVKFKEGELGIPVVHLESNLENLTAYIKTNEYRRGCREAWRMP